MRLQYIILGVLISWLSLLCPTRIQGQDIDKIKVDVNLTNAKVEESLLKLEAQSDYIFSFEEKIFAAETKMVSLSATQISFKEALDRILEHTRLTYRVEKKYIYILPLPPAPGFLWGKVIDNKTGEALVAATIMVGGQSYSTDSIGHYKISLLPGKYDVDITYIGYKTKKILGILITDNAATSLNIRLVSETGRLAEVTVQARRKAVNEVQLLKDRRNSAVVSDAISAQTIEKTASITTTQALQRIAGITVTDDKYVAIRGLGDRSVVAELNGARLSSANPDRSAVPLDLVPAALLDNITVYKTFSPDHPADASAGIIELKTKSVPDSLTVQFIAQGGSNSSIGLGGQYNSFYHSNVGYFGQSVKEHDLSGDFINLGKQYPGGTTQIQQFLAQSFHDGTNRQEAYRIDRIMKQFDPVLTTSYKTAAPNQIYSVTIGNSFKVWHGHELGLILSGNYYQRTEDIYQGDLTQYSIYQGVVTGSPSIYSPLHIPVFISPGKINLGKYLSYKENTGKQELNYGLLAALTYRFNPRNQVSAQFLGSRGAEASGSSLLGQYDNTGLTSQVYNSVYLLKQSYRVFNTENFQGEHRFLNSAYSPQISWNVSFSQSSQNEPDFRFSDLADKNDQKYAASNGIGIGSDTYAFIKGTATTPDGLITADPNGRRFRYLKEENQTYKVNLAQPFYIAGNKQELKFGYAYLHRDRIFTENILGLPDDNASLNKAKGNLDALVSYTNIGLGDASAYNVDGQAPTVGFLYNLKKSPDNYSGSYDTRAYYGMLDARIGTSWRLIGGVRFESTDIASNVDTVNAEVSNPNTPVHTSYKVAYKPYYSGNLVYTFKSSMNFRLGYSTTLARPELRELTDIYEFDPFQFAVVIGNRNLHNQLTKSADFRWEWFPRSNEVFSVSVFYKEITDQLTKVFSLPSQGNAATAPEYPTVYFVNDPNQGKVYGIELEARKDLSPIFPYVRHFYIGTNLLLANSVIDKNADRLKASRIIDRLAPGKSPIFEQAPYSVNIYLDYTNPRTRTSVTCSFNMVGERLIQVQLDGTPDLYSLPVPVLDLVFSQHFLKRWTIKGFAKNLLDPAYKEAYTQPGNQGTYHGNRYLRRSYYKGTEYSLGFTYNLF